MTFYRLKLHIVQSSKRRIQKYTNINVQQSLFCFVYFQYFQKDLPEILEHDPEQLFNLAFSMKINAKQMKKWEKEYAAVRKKEQEEMGELRVRPPKFNNLRTG